MRGNHIEPTTLAERSLRCPSSGERRRVEDVGSVWPVKDVIGDTKPSRALRYRRNG